MTSKDRPVAQEAQLEGHVEIDRPMHEKAIIMDDEIAAALAEDILRVVNRHETETQNA